MSSITRILPALLLVVAGMAGISGCEKESSSDASENSETTASDAKVAAAAAIQKARSSEAPNADAPSDCAGKDKAEGMAEGGEYECQKSELGCNKWDAEAAAVLKNDVPADASWQTYKVSGMTCGGCERKVIAKLGKIEGVVGVEADAELGQVRVAVSPKVPAAEAAALDKLGKLYKVDGKI